MPAPSTCTNILERHFAKFALVVLALAVVNLAWRLSAEIVSEWDESLYAISAWEMTRSGQWIATTFLGHLDYYNVKPPLNVWLIAASFKLFGANLISMRLVSTISACCTVAVVQIWGRRLTRPAVGLMAGVVLATSFAFVYIHAGRSGNTDPLFTLLILLIVVTLWAAQERHWPVVWLGPLAAAVFLLKGMAVLMPLSIIASVETWRQLHGRRRQCLPAACAVLLFAAPVGAWIVARWQVDQSRFLERLFFYDFVGGSLTALEGHDGGPLYYVNILLKYHYGWLLTGTVALLMFPPRWSALRGGLTAWRDVSETTVLLASWVAMTLLIPTLMRTKNSWYLQPFYPAYALGIAWLVVRGLTERGDLLAVSRRHAVLVSVLVLVFAVAEGRLVAYSYHYRALTRSPQGLLLAEAEQLAGQRVFRERWTSAEIFVVRALIGAEYRTAEDIEIFLRESRPGDYLVSAQPIDRSDVCGVRTNGQEWLYRRVMGTEASPTNGMSRTGQGSRVIAARCVDDERAVARLDANSVE